MGQVYIQELIVFDPVLLADEKHAAVGKALERIACDGNVHRVHSRIVIAEQNPKVQSKPGAGLRGIIDAAVSGHHAVVETIEIHTLPRH